MRINFKSEYMSRDLLLDGEGIDTCSDLIEEQLNNIGVERQNLLRIRLSFEESLLRMRDRFGSEQTF